MRNILIVLVSTGLVAPIYATMMDLGGMHGGGHHSAGRGFNNGFGLFGTYAQTHFEDKFTDLMGAYDDGLAEIKDYYNSNEEITYFDGLLAEYQASEEFTEGRLETWNIAIQDNLGLKIDIVTGKQSLLTENYATYAAFGDEINASVDSIVVAGGGTTDVDETVAESTAFAVSASLYDPVSCAEALGRLWLFPSRKAWH